MYRNIRLTEKSKEKLDLLMTNGSYKSISDCIIYLCDKEKEQFERKKEELQKDIEYFKLTIDLAEHKYDTIFKAKEKLQKDYHILIEKMNELKS